MKSVYCNKHMN